MKILYDIRTILVSVISSLIAAFIFTWIFKSEKKDFSSIIIILIVVTIIVIYAISACIIYFYNKHKKQRLGHIKIFKDLDVNELKVQAKRWAEKYPEASIKKIILYRYSSNYQVELSDIVPTKYLVVFEVPENSNPDCLETATEYYQTASKEYLAFIGSDFDRVYQDSIAGRNFKKDWMFYVKRPTGEFPLGIKIDEPNIVLYKA